MLCFSIQIKVGNRKTEKLPKVSFKQCSKSVIWPLLLAQIHMTIWPTKSEIRSNWSRFKVQTLLKIIHLASRTSYQVIHYLPQFTWKVDQKQNYVGSNIAQNHFSSICSLIWSLFATIHMKSWPKTKLRRFEHCSESLF